MNNQDVRPALQPVVRFKVSDVAEILGVSKSTINRLARERRIESYLIGGELRFTQESITQYIESCRRPRTRGLSRE